MNRIDVGVVPFVPRWKRIMYRAIYWGVSIGCIYLLLRGATK